MTVLDRRRLDPSVFALDERLREGFYTDQYFLNVRDVLARLAEEGYVFGGSHADLEAPPPEGVDLARLAVGDLEAEMQVFTKRRPLAIACGVDHALAILKAAAGCGGAAGRFQNTAARLQVEAVHDGTKLAPWVPALKIRGRYRDYAILETVILGALARSTSIATRAYEILQAAGGRPVLFFSARFDPPSAQAADGYAYKVAVDVYNRDTGRRLPAMVTTAAQGQWFGGRGGGTVSHSYVLVFLKDCAEAMLQFARLMPPEVPRIALVDTRGDCVGDAVRTALVMFLQYQKLRAAGQADEAERYRLFAVRCDTAGEVRDASVPPLGDPALDLGVVPRLVTRVREALDNLASRPDIPQGAEAQARQYFRGIRIVVSGGFDPDRIRRFEALGVPADIYGVGSAFLTGPACDFTADLVRVRLGGQWIAHAKTGRAPLPNPDLEPVEME
jgi:nicotinate phosphoribosyltransferase